MFIAFAVYESHKTYVRKIFSFFLPKLGDIRRKCCKTCWNIYTSAFFYECGIRRKRITTYYSHSTPLLGISEQSRKMLVNAVADSLWLFSVLENKWSESYLFMTQIFAWIKRIGKELWLKYADLNLKILQFHSDILEPARIRTNNAG